VKLTGETTGPALGRERSPINIAPEAKEALTGLLYRPEMRGVGFSEFILRAVDAAWGELGYTPEQLRKVREAAKVQPPAP